MPVGKKAASSRVSTTRRQKSRSVAASASAVGGTPETPFSAGAVMADAASNVYNHVYDSVMEHFVNVRPATPVNFIYPDLSIWRSRADLVAARVKQLGTYYSHLRQSQLAVAIAAMHERSVNGLIYGIYQLRRGA